MLVACEQMQAGGWWEAPRVNVKKAVSLEFAAAIGKSLGAALEQATVVFLGDYCDRGPNTREVLDWLLELEASRKPGRTIFLAGNHDFAFGCFLKCLDHAPDFDLDATKNPAWTKGFWAAPVEGGMHYQGRRWGGDGESDIYDARPTFASYGVDWGETTAARDALLAAVPAEHKAFLNRLVWLWDSPVAFEPGRMLCVHAGLLEEGALQPQLKGLRSKDIACPALQTKWGRFEALSGRREVEAMHPELAGRAMLVSGHHGFTRLQGDRVIMDTSGGRVGDEWPVEAIILPARTVVSSKPAPAPRAAARNLARMRIPD